MSNLHSALKALVLELEEQQKEIRLVGCRKAEVECANLKLLREIEGLKRANLVLVERVEELIQDKVDLIKGDKK